MVPGSVVVSTMLLLLVAVSDNVDTEYVVVSYLVDGLSVVDFVLAGVVEGKRLVKSLFP